MMKTSSQIQGGADMQATKVRFLIQSFALMVGLILLASSAFAQPGVAFTVSSLPQQARIEGLTETMGAVQATNNSTAAGTLKAGSSITVLYSGTITNLQTAAGSNNNAVLSCSGITNNACGGNITVGPASGGQITISISTTDAYFAPGAFMLISQVR